MAKIFDLGDGIIEYDLKPGVYYIGDPCYVFHEDTWQILCNITECFKQEGVVKWKGREMAVFHTAYGDGEYFAYPWDEVTKSYKPVSFSVDSGLLAAVPIELVEEGLTADAVVVDTRGEELNASREGGYVKFWRYGIETAEEYFGEDEEEAC